LDFGPDLYFYCRRYSIIHLFAKKWSSIAPDKDILRGFQYIKEMLSKRGPAFSDVFRQEPCALHILKDSRQHDVELKHGDTAELFYTLRLRR